MKKKKQIIEKEKLARCSNCEEISDFIDFEELECFKLSDFEEVADKETDLILLEKVEEFVDGKMTLDCVQCPYCNTLIEKDDLEVFEKK